MQPHLQRQYLRYDFNHVDFPDRNEKASFKLACSFST